MLGFDQFEQLVLQVEQVTADLGGVQGLVLLLEPFLDFVADALFDQEPLVGGRGDVVALGDFGAVAGLLDELLLA